MNSSDKKGNKKPAKGFPGYKHYPGSEDITSQEKKADLDVENLSRSHNNPSEGLKERKPEEQTVDYSPEIVPGTEADVTADDLKNLGPLDHDMDEGEDETLIPSLKIGPDLSGDDLDIPGADAAEDEVNGNEDEENDFYSRGQD